MPTHPSAAACSAKDGVQDCRPSPIVEDDYDSEYSYGGAPLSALMALDHADRVIYCASFNDTTFSGVRVRFVVARGEACRKLQGNWQLLGRCTPLAEQIALARHLQDGLFAHHLCQARHTYAQRRDALIGILNRHTPGLFAISGHEAGFHFVLRLQQAACEQDVCHAAADAELTLQGLSSFCQRVSWPPAVLVGYAALNMTAIEHAGRAPRLPSRRLPLSLLHRQHEMRETQLGRRAHYRCHAGMPDLSGTADMHRPRLQRNRCACRANSRR